MKNFVPLTNVNVGINFGAGVQTLGRLAMRERTVYFEFEQNFISSGIEISPLRLPLKPGVQSFRSDLFDGLPGVFNDSLPDGWGRLLFDRFIISQGILPSEISPLDRLAHIGQHALGALVFEPDYSAKAEEGYISLENLDSQAQEVLNGKAGEVVQKLIALNGSSAGARPKALIGVNDTRDRIVHGARDLPVGYTPWMVKFPNSHDGNDAGAVEYVYALMAKEAGITMPSVHIFPSAHTAGYFAIKRFDREGSKRYHMHTACGILHSDFRTPSLDYEDLIALTGMLTHDVREVEKLYRLAVFNVLAHNRDDHSKNFSYLMDSQGKWKLSPAYDLTFAFGPGGEQSTMVMGEGRNPRIKQLLQLSKEANISKARADEIIETTQYSLSKWQTFAKQYGVSREKIKLIHGRISEIAEL